MINLWSQMGLYQAPPPWTGANQYRRPDAASYLACRICGIVHTFQPPRSSGMQSDLARL